MESFILSNGMNIPAIGFGCYALNPPEQKRILLEVGFIRLCTPQMETDSASLLERVHLLEKKLEPKKDYVLAVEYMDNQ